MLLAFWHKFLTAPKQVIKADTYAPNNSMEYWETET
jgi:hypothetical protein